MALRGKPPSTIEKRFKALFYGPPGSGKTTAAIGFPKPYMIDTERGAENASYVERLEKSGGAYLFTTDADELIAEVVALLSEKHPYKTLVIDPLTVIYNDLTDKGMQTHGEDFGRYKIPADRKIKHLLRLLTRLDMNVIITSHAKDKWVRTRDAKGKEVAACEGITFDCYGKLDYLFDVVLEVGKRGADRVATVRKTRVDGIVDGDIFPFSYDEIAERYGRKQLERDAVPVALATAEQVAELESMLEPRADREELMGKWLDKAGAENFGEMTSEQVAACVALLTKRGGTK